MPAPPFFMTSGGFGCGVSQSTTPGLHWELVRDIKKSAELTMPTDAKLRDLPIPVDAEIAEDEIELYDNRRTKRAPVFTSPLANTETKTNGLYGIFLGHNRIGNEVWAHLIKGYGFLCDEPHRAYILVESINDRRDASHVRPVLESGNDWRDTSPDRPVLVSGLLSLGEVSQWDAGIGGQDLVTRYRFIYDALLHEAHSSLLE